MGSPYLSGLLDDFMNSDYQPLIQTSRFCPYTCAFCVSGKTRGKLRGYPIEQVKEELRYVSKKYSDRLVGLIDGKIIFDEKSENINKTILEKIYV